MVSQAIHDLGVAIQSAEGTAATAAEHRTRLTGGTVSPMRAISDLEETSRDRLRSRAMVNTVGVEGAPAMYARPASLGVWLYGALGAKAVSGASDPWTHTFTLANLLPNLTVWRMLGDLVYERMVDCKVGQLVLASEAGGALTATATVVGKKPMSIDSATFTTEAEAADIDEARPFYHYDGESAYMIPARAAAITLTTPFGAAATDLLTAAGHGLAAGDPVQFITLAGGTGLTVGTTYYVIAAGLTANAFSVSATPGGAAFDFTTDITAGTLAEMQVLSTMRSQSLTINNNASRWQGDALMAEEVTEGMLDINIETQQRIDAAQVGVWNRYHYGTETPAVDATPSAEVIELAAGGLSFKWTAAATPERSLQILAPRLQIASISGYEPGTGQDPLVATVTYHVYSPSSGSGLTAKLRNGEASYG